MTALYPTIEIERIRRPSRSFAIPLLGFLVKLILIVPVSIELTILRWAQFLFSILNACNIFFRGRYWKMAYDINIGVMRLETNLAFYLFGLTDKYPGFSLISTPDYTLTLPINKSPNRLFATPLLGLIARIILLLPYLVYRQILTVAAFLAVLVSWVSVLWKRRYPETTYELVRDFIRVDQAVSAYFLGMSDTYPSWWISMKHKPLKILLLVLGTLILLWNLFANINTHTQQRKYNQQLYQYSISQTPTQIKQTTN